MNRLARNSNVQVGIRVVVNEFSLNDRMTNLKRVFRLKDGIRYFDEYFVKCMKEWYLEYRVYRWISCV